MYKWFGDLNGKYADYSGATVRGAGSVKSATLRCLPTFAAEFTGALSGGSAMAFTIDSERNPLAAIDAIALDRAVAIDDGAVVTIRNVGRLKAGTYTLLSAPAVTGGTGIGVEMAGGGRVRVTGTAVLLDVDAVGTVLIFK